MTKVASLKQGAASVLFWSIIAAAFIGPGTVATAAKAGASYELALLWTLVYATFSTIILQEAAARLTLASGKSLGEVINWRSKGRGSKVLRWGLFVSIAMGCAAYQAGNMLGAVAGWQLAMPLNPHWVTLGLAVVSGTLLWRGDHRSIAQQLGILVATMGVAFILLAIQGTSDWGQVLLSSVRVSIPDGAGLLVVGLIGTTIVPYNLFLASGISKGQSVKQMRWGLGLAVLIGGIISIAILLVGRQVEGSFSFATLADLIDKRIGSAGSYLLGFGLFAAGLSSAITAPFAAAITAQSLLGFDSAYDWGYRSKRFRMVWGAVLLIGLGFGLSGVKPVPAIILAQAVNGFILPGITIFLWLAINDPTVIQAPHRNSMLANSLLWMVVVTSCFLGIYNLIKLLCTLSGVELSIWLVPIVWSSIGISLLIGGGLLWRIRK